LLGRIAVETYGAFGDESLGDTLIHGANHWLLVLLEQLAEGGGCKHLALLALAVTVAVGLALGLFGIETRGLLDGGRREALLAFGRRGEGRVGPVLLFNDLLLLAEDLHVIEGALLGVLGHGFRAGLLIDTRFVLLLSSLLIVCVLVRNQLLE
jgi:hypothetical protein